MNRKLLLAGAALALAFSTAGCAVAPMGQPPAPAPGTPAPAPGTPSPAPSPRAAVVDTTPSSEARAVLQSIPEPLPPGERVPPPAVATPEAADTLEQGEGDVPVPEPTLPLGAEPRPSPLDTTVAPPTYPPPPATPPAEPPPAEPPPAAPSDTCWRVQIAAPAEEAKAERYREAAESQLFVPWTVEREKGLWKVRSKGCMGALAAEALKRRALDSGFAGSFRFVGKLP